MTLGTVSVLDVKKSADFVSDVTGSDRLRKIEKHIPSGCLDCKRSCHVRD